MTMSLDESPGAIIFGVEAACGRCGGLLHMETCETRNGRAGHHYVLGSECLQCGERNDDPMLRCDDCDLLAGVAP